MTQVAIQTCDNYKNAKQSIENIFELHGGIESFFKKGEKVLVKPNLLAPRKTPDEPVTTDKDMIIAVSEILIENGNEVIVGDSPAFSTARVIIEKLGILEQLETMGVKVIDFDRPRKTFQGLTFDQALDDCDKILNLPKLKVHCQLGITISVKNLFGFVTGKRKPYLHMTYGDKENIFAEMLVKNYKEINPAFTIVDAVIAMENKGPRGGDPKNIGYLFAGTDCIAIDRVVNEALGLSFEETRVLKAAQALNVGEWDLDNIQLLGEKEIPEIKLNFPLPIPISFSPYRVIKSTIKNMMIKRRQQKEQEPVH